MLGRREFRDVAKRNEEHDNSYGEAWANVGSTPFRLYKHYLHEGGSATPFFMHWPAKIAPRADWYDDTAQHIDVMPTLLDVAGATYPAERKGRRPCRSTDLPASRLHRCAVAARRAALRRTRDQCLGSRGKLETRRRKRRDA